MQGFISLHRKLTRWEWYDDHKTTRLFIHLLLIASYKEHRYRGVLVKRGQIITGYEKLSNEVGISIQSLRTSLNRLKSTSEVTIKTSSKGTIIQVVNYDTYQQSTSEATIKQQASNNQSTTINKDNKDNKDKEEFKNSLFPYLDVYGREMLNEFFAYWTEQNDNGKKMRYQYAKNQPFSIKRRLSTWSNKQQDFKPKPISKL